MAHTQSRRIENNSSALQQATAMYRKALLWLEAELGPAHPNVVICRKNYEALLKREPRA